MTAAGQGLLEGISPPPPAVDQPVRVAAQGLLQGDAQVRHLTNGDAVVICLVRQHLQQHPHARNLLATLTYRANGAATAAHQAAYSKAKGLRANTEVMVLGSGLEPDFHEGDPVLRFISVEGIKPMAELTR